MRRTRAKLRHVRGQAAVETALTLPLVLFLFLGIMQLFTMMHGRVMTQYAAYTATRAGSVNHGSCTSMQHAAILALLPAIGPYSKIGGASAGIEMANAFKKYKSNLYNDVVVSAGGPLTYTGSIVWIARALSNNRGVKTAINEEEAFDQGLIGTDLQLTRLETRLIFWYPMRIPFANWVVSRMLLAHMGLKAYTGVNPLTPAQNANWDTSKGGSNVDAPILAEMLARHQAGEYVFPIEATYTMRMMTPVRPINFRSMNCAPTPAGL